MKRGVNTGSLQRDHGKETQELAVKRGVNTGSLQRDLI